MDRSLHPFDAADRAARPGTPTAPQKSYGMRRATGVKHRAPRGPTLRKLRGRIFSVPRGRAPKKWAVPGPPRGVAPTEGQRLRGPAPRARPAGDPRVKNARAARR